MTKHFCLMSALCLATAGCAVNDPHEVNEKYRGALDERRDHYRLKPGDTIDINFYDIVDSRLDQSGILVLPDGRSDLFFMKSAMLAGKTVPEIESEVKTRLAGEIDPTDIRIQVTPAEETVLMVGEFETPGPIPLPVGMTLQQAISAAGGMKVTGDTDWALVRRPYFDSKTPDLFRIDLNDQSRDIYLLPGDQIILGRTFLASMVLYVREYVFGFIPPGIWTLAFL